ncbi:MAG: vitamin K epoxide reductase family protein [bacterium]
MKKEQDSVPHLDPSGNPEGRDREGETPSALDTRAARWPAWALGAVSLAGAALALYASYQTIYIRWRGLVDPSACSVNAWINCDAVLASSYAFFRGLPVAWWGLLYYVLILGIGLWAIFRRTDRTVLAFGGLATLLALVFTGYKAFTLFFVLKLLCPVCVSMYLVNLALFWLFMRALGFRLRELPLFLRGVFASEGGGGPRLRLLRGAAFCGVLAVAVFAGGVVLADRLEKRYFKLPEFDVAAEVENHFQQGQKTVRVHPQAPVWGNPQARVAIVEFSDFQCSHCRDAAFHLRGLLWEFRDQVRFVFANFPLDPKINRYIRGNIHPYAGLAARAAVCAQRRGKFWQFHDDLFQKQQNLSRDLMLDLAEKYGWPRREFEREMEDIRTYVRVRSEIEYTGGIIRSTPTLVINGRRVKYWRHPEIVQEIIREEIRRQTN